MKRMLNRDQINRPYCSRHYGFPRLDLECEIQGGIAVGSLNSRALWGVLLMVAGGLLLLQALSRKGEAE